MWSLLQSTVSSTTVPLHLWLMAYVCGSDAPLRRIVIEFKNLQTKRGLSDTPNTGEENTSIPFTLPRVFRCQYNQQAAVPLESIFGVLCLGAGAYSAAL